jgi:DNA-binding beta-propeller fold protein YncE
MTRLALAIVIGLTCLSALPARARDLLLAGFSADQVFRYDGITATPFASHPSMDGPTALVYDAAGNLLVLNEFSNNVLKFNGTTGAFIGTLIDTPTIDSVGLHDAADMEMGPDGNLYLMAHFNNPFDAPKNIHKFSATTGAYLGVFSSGRPFRHQHGLAWGPGGNLYQGNVADSTIESFNGATGAFLGTFAGHPSLFPIADLAFGPTKLFVTVDGHGIRKFNSITGAFEGDVEPDGPSQAYWGLCIDGGFLYASNISLGSIRKYDAVSGAFISETIIGGGAFDIMPMVVPEPSSLAILALGAGMLARRS